MSESATLTKVIAWRAHIAKKNRNDLCCAHEHSEIGNGTLFKSPEMKKCTENSSRTRICIMPRQLSKQQTMAQPNT